MAKETQAHGVPTKPRGALDPDAPHRNSLQAFDMFTITNAQPDRAYRFVSRKLLESCGGFDRRGWIPINSQNTKGEALISPFGTVSEGTDVVNGDTILAYMPREQMEVKKKMADRRKGLMEASLNRLRAGKRNGLVQRMDVTIQRQGRTEDYGQEGAHA